jgi:hypothetical protein
VLAVTDSGKKTAYDWVAFGDPVIETTTATGGVAFTSDIGNPDGDIKALTTFVQRAGGHDSDNRASGTLALIDMERLFKPLLATAKSLTASFVVSRPLCTNVSSPPADDRALTVKCAEQEQL